MLESGSGTISAWMCPTLPTRNLACGTGSIAAALVTAHKTGWQSPIHVYTRSGIVLAVHFSSEDGRYKRIFLEGDARVIYEGKLWEDAWT